MRAVLTNFGSVGDLQPFLALALEMRRCGDVPVLAFSPYFRSRVEKLGFDFVPIGPDLQAIQNNVNVSLRNVSDSADRIREILSPLVTALPQAFSELSRISLNADVLIGGPTQPAARMVHETIGIPFVSIQVSHFGGIGSPALRKASADLINPLRVHLGLAPLQNPLTMDANSPQLALYAMSRYVRPPLGDWPSNYQLTGYFFLDDEQWQPEPELVSFLESGERPVVISFGSMTYEDPSGLSNLLLEAIRLTGCRAIIQQGWGGIGRQQLPEAILTTGYVPHEWLFSHARCIVHHSGAGTMSAVFRSGVPSICVPHGYFSDQVYWAEIAHALGCAAQPLPLSQLTAERLATAIKRVIEDPAYCLSAAVLANEIRSEPGVRLARHLIDQLLRKIGQRQMDWDFRTRGDSFRERGHRVVLRKQFQHNRRSSK
jgi:sterol 3beta-glucosyltransferase